MFRTSALVLALALVISPSLALAQGSVIRVVKSDKPTEVKPKPKPKPTVAAPLPRAVPAPPPAAASNRPEPRLTPSLTTEPERTSIAPWVTLTGSLVVGLIGAFFTVRTFNAIDEDTEIEVNAIPGMSVKLPEEFKDQQKAVLGNGIAATVLLSTAAAGTIASLVMLTAD